MPLSNREAQILLGLSRTTLPAHFSNKLEEVIPRFENEFNPIPKPLMATRPCFVTLTLWERLRGCIGNIVGYQPLYLGVFELTQHAAFRDPRFKPVAASEVADLKISITILGDLKPLSSQTELIVGKHGLSVRYQSHHGVLLAEVAAQYCWTPEEFIEQVCVKAGLDPNHRGEYPFFYFEEQCFSE